MAAERARMSASVVILEPASTARLVESKPHTLRPTEKLTAPKLTAPPCLKNTVVVVAQKPPAPKPTPVPVPAPTLEQRAASIAARLGVPVDEVASALKKPDRLDALLAALESGCMGLTRLALRGQVSADTIRAAGRADEWIARRRTGL